MTVRLILGPRGEKWGEVDDKLKVYYTARKLEHFCHKWDGYGIQKSLLTKLRDEGIAIIVIRTPRGNLLSRIGLWFERGIEDTLRPSDGLQIFLPLKDFGNATAEGRKP